MNPFNKPPGNISTLLATFGAHVFALCKNLPTTPGSLANLAKLALASAVLPTLAKSIAILSSFVAPPPILRALNTGFATTSPAIGIADIKLNNPKRWSPCEKYDIPLIISIVGVGSKIPRISPTVLYHLASLISFDFDGYKTLQISKTNFFSFSERFFQFCSVNFKLF